ncbi:hypothetical protein BO70DRAFT_33070 [Aspergillus heteromorphus CBS 117.55]|uniref:Uncharacterized protein n=1 Tax=Aspergillus heteromorphus CBS 117.55 TaxID=1448321 RepID=A0A317WCP0_9EURO|nr:uncharacterized protein BO70DRAFT_33070 [Aspergillus heteromorphus CBS 117.55]PWY82972.1 hypothetical protein BO70DRAFT_33070 [Aspergillus heteromorphus CBS 117.55]
MNCDGDYDRYPPGPESHQWDGFTARQGNQKAMMMSDDGTYSTEYYSYCSHHQPTYFAYSVGRRVVVACHPPGTIICMTGHRVGDMTCRVFFFFFFSFLFFISSFPAVFPGRPAG